MSEFKIESFKYGLDARRDVLSSVKGTLEVIENAFINSGGEIEKIKAFDLYANINIVDSNGDETFFGLLSTSAGLVCFTSALEFGASVTQGQPTLASLTPAGIIRTQLKHPSLVNDSTITYDRTLHRLSAIIFSINYNGKSFACGQFTDGRRYLYYDGTLIQDSVDGLVLEGRATLTDLGEDLVREITTVGYNTELNVDESGVAQAGSVIVKSPPGDFFKPLASETSTLGEIGERMIAQNGASIAAVKAIASFQITGNSGTFTLTAPNQATATTPTVDLCGGPVVALGTAILTASAIAQAVNDFSTVHGYSAQTNTLDSVFVYAPENYDLTVGLDLTVAYTTGNVGVAGPNPTSLGAAITPNPAVNELVIIGRRVPTLVTITCSVIAVGGTGPYTYVWSAVSGAALVGIVSGGGTSTMTFGSTLFNGSAEAVYKCVVTDSLAVPVTAFVNIKLSFFNFAQT